MNTTPKKKNNILIRSFLIIIFTISFCLNINASKSSSNINLEILVSNSLTYKNKIDPDSTKNNKHKKTNNTIPEVKDDTQVAQKELNKLKKIHQQ